MQSKLGKRERVKSIEFSSIGKPLGKKVKRKSSL